MKKPTGFISICQCGNIVGAVDYNRYDVKNTGKLIGKWLHNGCTVKPIFEDTWKATIKNCECEP